MDIRRLSSCLGCREIKTKNDESEQKRRQEGEGRGPSAGNANLNRSWTRRMEQVSGATGPNNPEGVSRERRG